MTENDLDDLAPDSWSSYPKIHALGHANIAGSFKITDTSIFEEKVDGSQFSFGVFDGQVRMRSRKIQLHEVDVSEGHMFAPGCTAVQVMASQLHPGWTYRGEYLRKPSHNAIAYERIPTNHIILFDICVGGEKYLTRPELEEEAKRLGLEVVKVLHVGKLRDSDHLREIISEGKSSLGGMIEGVVIKDQGRSVVFDPGGKPVYAKYVTDAFKEIHKVSWNKQHPNAGSVIDTIVAGLKMPARWEKAVYRLRDEGTLTGECKDIGPLMKEVNQDIEAECAEDVKNALWKHYRKEILRKSTSPIPQWYKDRLASAALDKDDEDEA